ALVLRRTTSIDLTPVLTWLETLVKAQERTERSVRDEITASRKEAADQARGLREEVQGSLRLSTESIVQRVTRITVAQQQRLEEFANQLHGLRQATENNAAQLRSEL